MVDNSNDDHETCSVCGLYPDVVRGFGSVVMLQCPELHLSVSGDDEDMALALWDKRNKELKARRA